MDVTKILADLRSERDKLERAIQALEGIGTTTRKTGGVKRGRRRKRHLTAEGRRRLSEAMKRRWAERKGGRK